MADLIKVALTGTLPGGEVWSVNPVFKVTTGSVISYAECLAIVTAVNAVSVPTGLRSAWNVATEMTGCRVEARKADGTLEALAEGLRPAPAAGSGTQIHPYQTSLVTSLRTTTPGGSGRGRLYWPATGVTLDASTLRVNAGAVSTILGGVKSYMALVMAAVDASVDETVAWGVWSRTTDTINLITSVQLGDVVDTQRRRRDAETESISVVSWP